MYGSDALEVDGICWTAIEAGCARRWSQRRASYQCLASLAHLSTIVNCFGSAQYYSAWKNLDRYSPAKSPSVDSLITLTAEISLWTLSLLWVAFATRLCGAVLLWTVNSCYRRRVAFARRGCSCCLSLIVLTSIIAFRIDLANSSTFITLNFHWSLCMWWPTTKFSFSVPCREFLTVFVSFLEFDWVNGILPQCSYLSYWASN